MNAGTVHHGPGANPAQAEPTAPHAGLRLRRRTTVAAAAAGTLAAKLLGSAPAAATPTARSTATSTAAATLRPGTGAIDVHGHLLPTYWTRALEGRRVRHIAGVAAPRWSPARAVRFMDRHDIAAQVLSLPDPAVTPLATPGARLAMARRVNNHLHHLINSDRWPGRFGALAVVPLGARPTPGEVMSAAAEVDRALDELGLDGVCLLSNYGLTFLGDPALAPLMATLNAHAATVVVHPSVPPGPRPGGLPTFLLEGAFNTTRAVVSMSYRQTFTTNPAIRWVIGDGGGTLPYLAYRSSLLQVYPAVAQNFGIGDVDDQNFDYGRLSFDTANVGGSRSTSSLVTTREVVPATQVLFGTDWPLSTPHLPRRGALQPGLAAVFDDSERRGVMRRNALAHFPRLAARLGTS